MHAPLWTFVLLGANALVWLAMTLAGGSESTRVLVLFGAKYQPLIVQGQYWRLFTANFVHIGIVHLMMNSYALYIFGPQVERRFGRARFITLYLLSGVGGTALSYVGSNALSAGASAAIFGLIGAITVYYATHRRAFGEQGKQQLTGLIVVMGYNLVWGLMNAHIDNLAHLGGLLTGLALGWAYCPRYTVIADPEDGLQLRDSLPVARARAVTAAIVVLLIALAALGTHIHAGAGS